MSERTPEQELIEIRQAKVTELKKRGIRPYAYTAEYTHLIRDAVADFDQLLAKEARITVAGRIRSLRSHGKSTFLHVEDFTGRMQAYLKEDILGKEMYSLLPLIDLSDFLEITGTLFVTKTGEKTILATSIRMLAKTIRPLPDEWYGLKDKEVRFRKRYIDLQLNPEVKKRFIIRAKVIQLIRDFLNEREFVEVETPVLQVLYGGTNAKPFNTHINAYDMPMYLRIATELYLKRLVVGGFDRVYEIGKDFRNEGVDQGHNPEFTMIEWYQAYADYHVMMDTAEAMYKYIAKKLYGTESIPKDGETIDISGKWQRIPLCTAVTEKIGVDVTTLSDDQIDDLIEKHHIDVKGQRSRGQKIFGLFDKLVSPTLIDPVWIIDYPRDVSPLSKEHRDDPTLVERFECYIGGREVGDGWSEITSAAEQLERFENEQNNMKHGDEDAHPIDHDFLEALDYGMPPLGGIGIGIDRLVMTYTDTDSIREIILFPTMKPQEAPSPQAGEPIEILSKSSTVISGSDLWQKDMKLELDSAVATRYPDLKLGMVVIQDVSIQKSSEALEAVKTQVLASLASLTHDDWKNSSNLQSYRDIYRSFGVDPNKQRPSADALLHRIVSGKGLYKINTCVDAYNTMSAKHQLCMAVYDLDQVSTPLNLRFSQAGEKLTLIGDDQPTTVGEGELVYADREKVICLDFNYRDNVRTKVTEKTKNIVLLVDGCGSITSDQIEKARKETSELITALCGGRIVEESIVTATPSGQQTGTLDAGNHVRIPREQAMGILTEWTKTDNLIKHALSVEAACRFYAEKLNEDADLWGITGLLHDADWDMAPNEHPNLIMQKLESLHADPAIAQAIRCHGTCFGFPQVSLLDKVLFAVDELSGMITACAYVRPDKSLASVEVRSVLKKMKDKAFARGVNREDVYKGAEQLGIPLEEHIQNVLTAMQKIAPQLGL